MSKHGHTTQRHAHLERSHVAMVTKRADERVRLKLVDVSKPGSGPSARNYTAISEVSLVGSPD